MHFCFYFYENQGFLNNGENMTIFLHLSQYGAFYSRNSSMSGIQVNAILLRAEALALLAVLFAMGANVKTSIKIAKAGTNAR
jgi:hypothetical protein